MWRIKIISLNELPKQNWVEITKEQIKSIPEGKQAAILHAKAMLGISDAQTQESYFYCNSPYLQLRY